MENKLLSRQTEAENPLPIVPNYVRSENAIMGFKLIVEK